MKPRWGEVLCRKCKRFIYKLTEGETAPSIGPICSECMKNKRFSKHRRWKDKS